MSGLIFSEKMLPMTLGTLGILLFYNEGNEYIPRPFEVLKERIGQGLKFHCQYCAMDK